ncbi:hypothetical protein PMM47T1_21693 [Pseudomonas sp. M47T1]|uniref:hypothetical protein n=1 Tax=Pseudomonas sp. M47T1 TaxID=1179778 RepID=UPI0002606FFF|nr:hypothetical protein [Pseudomonas sp. M47T1]EIK94548.1 hypothetical protein PMM47T1_21693 [Pseudomonas sp. M47T1]
MNIGKYLHDFQNDLQQFIASEAVVSTDQLQEWQTMLGIMILDMEGVRGAIQGAADVHDGIALMAKLLDAAHTDKLDADQVRCLIEPLRDRLWITIEDARQVM